MITTAATLFYGRRTRPIRSFDELGFDDSSSSADSSSQNHRHRKNNQHRRPRHNHNLDDADRSRRSSPVLHPFDPSALAASEPPQGRTDESLSQNIMNREATHGLHRRYGGSDRLPGSVLLARERLLHRLRGPPASGVRDSVEASAGAHHNDFSLVDADWGTSVPREQPEFPVGAHQQSVPQESSTKPLGLTMETMSRLHHEVFLEPQKGVSNSMSKTSKDCSICLETFVEGNELISLHCGHRFHTKCLYPWLQSCGECPYCRSCTVIT